MTERDFVAIADIVSAPTFVALGVKRDRSERIIYVKETDDGTALYFEEVLGGSKNKALRGKSLSKKNGVVTPEKLLRILQANRRNDVFKIIIAFGVAANSTVDHPKDGVGSQLQQPTGDVSTNGKAPLAD